MTDELFWALEGRPSRPYGATDVSRADTDGCLYRNEDVYWMCEPTGDDPGWLAPKPGAIPISD